MTDPIAEAQVQENLNICVAQKYEALAEVERLKALHDMNQPYWAHIQQLKAEIARLRYGHPTNCPCVSAPPEGDVMEIARSALGYTVHPERIINDPKRFPDVRAVARALTRERADVHAKYAPLVEAAKHVIEISRQTTPHLSLSGKEQRLEDALRAIGEK